MPDLTHAQLATWESFYVIVGSSGGALVGIQFVVMTLIADMRPRSTSEGISAFGTPTVVHLAGALLVSAVMSAPWPAFVLPSVVLAAYGAGGVVYGGLIIQRARRQTEYQPVWQDWLWYALLPSITYAVLAVSALFLPSGALTPEFLIAGAALGLLIIGIHNAWDTVTHVIVTRARSDDAPRE